MRRFFPRDTPEGRMRRALPFLALALVSCGEPVQDNHFANDVASERIPSPPVATEAVPVRIGDLGANFDACAAAGTTRHLTADKRLPVRAAAFDTAAETGSLAAGSRFFICTRSHDQKWFGIVYDEDGTLAERCGVSAPVTPRRDYTGPCRSGWVSSAFVRLIAGVDVPTPAGQAEANAQAL
jgi:hypothetical protein